MYHFLSRELQHSAVTAFCYFFLTHTLICAVYSSVAILLTSERLSGFSPQCRCWAPQGRAFRKQHRWTCLFSSVLSVIWAGAWFIYSAWWWSGMFTHCFLQFYTDLNSALFCPPNSRSNDANIRYPIYFIKCLNSIKWKKKLQINLFTLSH